MGMSRLASTPPYHSGLPSQQAHWCRARCVFRRSTPLGKRQPPCWCQRVAPAIPAASARVPAWRCVAKAVHRRASARPAAAWDRGRPSSASPHEPLQQRQRPAQRLGVCLRTTNFANAGPGLASALGRGCPSLQAWWPCASSRGVTVSAQQARDVPLPIPRQQGCQTPHDRGPAITGSPPGLAGPTPRQPGASPSESGRTTTKPGASPAAAFHTLSFR